MRSYVRTVIVLALAVGLVALFFHNVDLWRVAADIVRARPEWLALSLATMVVNLAIRTLRWQLLLQPLGPTTFGSAFRATAVGFAASSILPARAGELIRPYFLARQRRHARSERMSATGAFATIVLERLLDIVTVLVLLASYVFIFGRDLGVANPMLFSVLKWAGASAGG
ncbi:MAG: flippase-like domain-containing protein, partial [Acidobacteria bacterium]|nr:flippase-like domain-containing protein [Acidobacteriota bacterium]